MSNDVVAYRGKLAPVDLHGQSIDSWIQEKLGTSYLDGSYSTWTEALEDECYGQYLYNESTGKLYEVQREKLQQEGFVQSTANPDGTIDFFVGFYNDQVRFRDFAKGILVH